MHLNHEEHKLIYIYIYIYIDFFFFIFTDKSKCDFFCAEVPNWGCQKTLPLTELGFLEKNKLTVEVYIKVVEVVHQGKSTENDIIDFNGFQIIASQVS